MEKIDKKVIKAVGRDGIWELTYINDLFVSEELVDPGPVTFWECKCENEKCICPK